MDGWPAYTTRQRARAVNVSAFLGWLAVAGPYCLAYGLESWIYAAIFGLPIAFLACWIIGAPILKCRMRHSLSWTSAAIWGGGISLLIAGVGVALTRYEGWRESRDPNFWSQVGAINNPSEIDGILTPYGWLMTAETVAVFAIVGSVIALMVRACIGPGEVTGAGG